jgi:type IV secretory pathway VirB10-like protein
MTSRAFLALALAIGPLISGCLHASARTIVDSPPLEIPAPPPRIIETVEVTPPAPLSLPEEPPRQPVSPPVAAVPPARPVPRAEAPVRSEPPPRLEPPAEPRVAEEAPRPTPTLQTTPAVAEVEVARGIRVTVDRAAADLKRVNFSALNGDGRTQYNTARRFIAQAEDALTKRNLVLARSLADKALVVAAQLAPR